MQLQWPLARLGALAFDAFLLGPHDVVVDLVFVDQVEKLLLLALELFEPPAVAGDLISGGLRLDAGVALDFLSHGRLLGRG